MGCKYAGQGSMLAENWYALLPGLSHTIFFFPFVQVEVAPVLELLLSSEGAI